jgi:hypothetical protein
MRRTGSRRARRLPLFECDAGQRRRIADRKWSPGRTVTEFGISIVPYADSLQRNRELVEEVVPQLVSD